MSDHTKLATARVADFLSERGWEGEFVADVLAKSPQHVKINGAHTIELVAAAMRAAPEGFVLVPVEPTEEMLMASKLFQCDHSENEDWMEWEGLAAANQYRAMLAARPQDPTHG